MAITLPRSSRAILKNWRQARHPLEIVTRNWFNINLDYKYYSLVSLMAMLSMVIVLLLTSLSIAREKEVGTFDQLIVSPLSSAEILIGKAVPAQLLAGRLRS